LDHNRVEQIKKLKEDQQNRFAIHQPQQMQTEEADSLDASAEWERRRDYFSTPTAAEIDRSNDQKSTSEGDGISTDPPTAPGYSFVALNANRLKKRKKSVSKL
jgi:hypothetical protein